MQEAEAFEQDSKINLLQKYAFPIYARHKLNARKMFRRHPEHLVNLFCTVNLHPVSMELLQLFATVVCSPNKIFQYNTRVQIA